MFRGVLPSHRSTQLAFPDDPMTIRVAWQSRAAFSISCSGLPSRNTTARSCFRIRATWCQRLTCSGVFPANVFVPPRKTSLPADAGSLAFVYIDASLAGDAGRIVNYLREEHFDNGGNEPNERTILKDMGKKWGSKPTSSRALPTRRRSPERVMRIAVG